jgi:hypothetical protein
VLTGLCVLTHLNGLMFVAAGTLLLLVRRRPGPAVVFAAVASAVSALYFADAALAGQLPTAGRQLLTDPMLVERFPDAGSRLIALLSEPQRYLHSRAEIVLTVLVLAVVIATARLTNLRRNPLVPFLLTLAATLAVLAPERQAHYAIPLLPYLAFVVAGGLVHGLPRLGGAGRAVLVTLFWLHAASGAAYYARIIATNEDTATRNRALASHIEPGATVVATLPFVFDEIETRTIWGLESYWVSGRYGRDPLPPDALLADARRRGARYVIMSRQDLAFSGWPEGAPGPSGPHHRTIHEDADHLIVELH